MDPVAVGIGIGLGLVIAWILNQIFGQSDEGITTKKEKPPQEKLRGVQLTVRVYGPMNKDHIVYAPFKYSGSLKKPHQLASAGDSTLGDIFGKIPLTAFAPFEGKQNSAKVGTWEFQAEAGRSVNVIDMKSGTTRTASVDPYKVDSGKITLARDQFHYLDFELAEEKEVDGIDYKLLYRGLTSLP